MTKKEMLAEIQKNLGVFGLRFIKSLSKKEVYEVYKKNLEVVNLKKRGAK